LPQKPVRKTSSRSESCAAARFHSWIKLISAAEVCATQTEMLSASHSSANGEFSYVAKRDCCGVRHSYRGCRVSQSSSRYCVFGQPLVRRSLEPMNKYVQPRLCAIEMGPRLYDPRQCGFLKHLARSPEAVIRHWCIVLKRHSIVVLRPDLDRSIQYGNRGSWR
jgi:hypothetical protein